MAIDTVELSSYEGKKVVAVVDLGDDQDAIEVEGTAERANELGLLIKPKGKVKLDLYEHSQIIEINLAPDNSSKMRRKTLKPVALGQARSHLLERHGLSLTEVNGLSEDEAFTYHESIDHVEQDLGHKHGDKSETKAAKAVADIEAENDDYEE